MRGPGDEVRFTFTGPGQQAVDLGQLAVAQGQIAGGGLNFILQFVVVFAEFGGHSGKGAGELLELVASGQDNRVLPVAAAGEALDRSRQGSHRGQDDITDHQDQGSAQNQHHHHHGGKENPPVLSRLGESGAHRKGDADRPPDIVNLIILMALKADRFGVKRRDIAQVNIAVYGLQGH